MSKIYIYIYIYILACKILRAIIKSLIFVTLCGSSLMFSWFNATVIAYWKYFLSFLLMGFIVPFMFLSNQENLYMIHHDFDLFYDIHNTINEHNQRQNHYFSLILNYFDIYFWLIQKVFC